MRNREVLREQRIQKVRKDKKKLAITGSSMFVIGFVVSASILSHAQTHVCNDNQGNLAHHLSAQTQIDRMNFLDIEEQEKSNVRYKCIKVDKGDTIWTLADTYIIDANIPVLNNKDATTQNAVKYLIQLNDLYNKPVLEGTEIIIPYQEEL